MDRRDLQSTNPPVAWFGVYPEAFVFDHRTGKFEGRPPDELIAEMLSRARALRSGICAWALPQESYAQKIAAIQEYIRSGDTYQVNFTDKLHFDFSGSPEAMFAALSESQPVPYSAFLHGENWHILSFSPELFFRVKDRRIVTRPMKGTARRGADIAEDEAIARVAAKRQQESQRERDDRGPDAQRSGTHLRVRKRAGGAALRGGEIRDALSDGRRKFPARSGRMCAIPISSRVSFPAAPSPERPSIGPWKSFGNWSAGRAACTPARSVFSLPRGRRCSTCPFAPWCWRTTRARWAWAAASSSIRRPKMSIASAC